MNGENRLRWRWVGFLFFLNKGMILIPAIYANRHLLPSYGWFSFMVYQLTRNFSKWDSGWYIKIATMGYDEKATAFFPLYPILMKGIHAILPFQMVYVGILLSNLSYILVLYFFLRLAELDLSPKESRKVALLFALYPTSYYFSAVYTEALFMLLTLAALYMIRTERWAVAGWTGFFAALTRNTGVFLSLPFAIEYFRSISPKEWWKVFFSSAARLIKRPSFYWVLLFPLGLLVYMAYSFLRFGDPLSFGHSQSQYGRSFLPPWQSLVDGIRWNIQWIWPWEWEKYHYYYAIELFFLFLVLIVLLFSFRKLRFSYWVILLYSFLIPLSAPAHGEVKDYFVSFSRYTLVLFPLYLGLYALVKKWWAYLITIMVFALLLFYMVYAWSLHRWVA